MSREAARSAQGARPAHLCRHARHGRVSLLASICLARFLPLDAEARFAIGFTLAIPIWIAAMCLGFLARDGVRAWLWCAGLGLLLGGLAYGIPPG